MSRQVRSGSQELTEEEKCTLWVGGINEQIDEEILYELFINVSPVVLREYFDPRGRPTVKAGSDNYFHTCCTSVRPSPLLKTPH